MDLSKLSTGDKVLGGSGIALFIFSFLRWYGLDQTVSAGTFSQHFSYSESGWDYFLFGIIPALLALALVAYVVVTKLLDGVTLPDLPFPWATAVLGAAGLAALLVVLKLLIGASRGGVDLDRKYGIFLATVAALGLAAGGFLKFQEDGGELPTKKASGTGDSGTPTPF
ncbi:MAG: hypothetical protein JWM89_583 [Acidimicrobiales bacterium]|nr:hypothetical protein [Acidimicrobiales bacterium]